MQAEKRKKIRKYSNANRIFNQHWIFNSLSSNHFSFENNTSKSRQSYAKFCVQLFPSLPFSEQEWARHKLKRFTLYAFRTKTANKIDNLPTMGTKANLCIKLQVHWICGGYAIVLDLVNVFFFCVWFACACAPVFVNAAQNMQMRKCCANEKCITTRRIKLNFVFMRVE